MALLILGLALFLGVHSVRILADGWRGTRVAKMGLKPWKGVVSAQPTVQGLASDGAFADHELEVAQLLAGEGTVGGESLNGRLRYLGGPLRVRGSIELEPNGRYLLTGEAAPGPGAGPAIFDTLSFLGPPDRQGRRPFTIEGSL